MCTSESVQTCTSERDGVCLLVFNFTITVCGHEISKKQAENPCIFSSDLQECIITFNTSTSAICNTTCMSMLVAYYEGCVGGNSAVAIVNTINANCGIPGANPCLTPSNFVQNCIKSLEDIASAIIDGNISDHNISESLACSSECESELDSFYWRCFDDTILISFRQSYNLACDATCRNVPPIVEDCANSFDDSDNTTACSSTCRFYLLDYLARCLPAVFVDFRDETAYFVVSLICPALMTPANYIQTASVVWKISPLLPVVVIAVVMIAVVMIA